MRAITTHEPSACGMRQEELLAEADERCAPAGDPEDEGGAYESYRGSAC